jgi:hypothetical protein
VLDTFDKQKHPDLVGHARQQLAAHGLRSDSTERVYDPVRRQWIVDPFSGGDPQTGNAYILKLHHVAESKTGGRGTGSYTSEGLPAKGGHSSSKRLSLMDVNALLSHGATGVLRDVAVRGQASPDHWAAYMSGHNPDLPEVPHVYAKFLASLRAAGIHPYREGTTTQLMALTNKDVDALAADRNLQNAETVDWKSGMKPIPGGLFSEELTGGHHGDQWSALMLHEPMPNPVMADPIRHMLGLTEPQFRDVLAGRAPLHGESGPRALQHALDRINVPKALEQARADVASGKKGLRDAAVRRLGYLKSAEAMKLHPRDWMLDRVPVLPPKFRPVSVMQGSKLPMVADANATYRELWDANENLKAMSGQVEDVGDEREAVYDALRGVVGLGDPITAKNQEREVKGILKHVFAGSPKFSMVQRKLLGGTVDLVGRAVISPDPDLDMDSAGIPESEAWESFTPFVVRSLVRSGVPRLRAAQAVKNREPMARAALAEEMDKRPVIVTRAPVLHRYGAIGMRGHLVPGNTLQLPTFVYKGLGGDNDGDTCTFHVPASDDAVADVYNKMLPSKNLFNIGEFKAHYLPAQEFGGGLYTASAARNEAKNPRTFATRLDAIKAHARGEVGVGDQVHVINDAT